MKIREVDIPDNRPYIIKAAEFKPSTNFYPPMTLGKPRGKTAEAKKVMAMDACIKNVLSGFRDELHNCGMPMFVGYGMLSGISQEALIRAGVETIADEMTRKFVKFRYDVDDGKNDHEQEISDLEEQAAKYKIKDIFNDAAQKDGYFGGCLVYIDVGELDDEEALEPLILDKKTFKKGMLKGFKVIEPVNIYAGEYNTTDPTDEHYFNPEYWYILGRRYHASRFLYFCGNSVPLLLKPAYNFFGIARAQLALDYIAHFVENRESAQELLNKFSLTCWKTNMTQVLAGDSCNDLVKRVKMFNKMKSNNGTLVVDKEQEDIMQINTPLGGVRDIVEMSLNLLTAVWRIPKIKYVGEGEGGLNASSKEQMRSFYDFIMSQKEKMFTAPLEKVLKILQLNMGKDINESIGFEFPSLVEMDDVEIANLNKMKAETAIGLINAGVVSQEEVRQNLSMDKNSGFSMIDVDDIPEEPEPPEEKEVVDVEDENLIFDEFEESEHPRSQNGRFTNKHSGQTEKENENGRSEKFDGNFGKLRELSGMAKRNLWVDGGRSENGSGNEHLVHTPSDYFKGILKDGGFAVNSYKELKKNDDGSVKEFLEHFKSSNKANSKASAQVYQYPDEDYKKMRLFVAENGKSGFALKEDGDIVSVFSQERKATGGMLELAIAQGGKKLDCFDTFLPKIYAKHGLKEYKRDKWAEEYKPDNWDKEYFKEFNNGEPDVVYMKVAGAVVGDGMKKSLWAKVKGFFVGDADFKESEHPRNSKNGQFVKKASSIAETTSGNVEKAKKNREYALSRISSPEQKKNYEEMFRKTDEINKIEFSDKDVIDRLEKKGKDIRAIQKRYNMYQDELKNAKRTESGKLVDTQYKYSDGEGHYNEDRKKIHKDIIDKYYINEETMNKYKVPDGVRPKVVILGGRGGSGKSKLKGLAYDPEKYLILDVDEIKEKLPEYGGRKGKENFGLNAWEVHEESSDIAKKIREKAQKNKMNVVLDMTCANLGSTLKKIKEFKDAGYDVDGAFMELTRDLSTERSMERGIKGRLLPTEQARGMKDNEKVFEEIMPYFNNWAIWDNSGAGKEEKPRLVASTYKI